jgi:hypothetical protein
MDITAEQLKDIKNIIKDAIKEAAPEPPKATMTIKECAKYSGIGKDKLMELAHSTNSDVDKVVLTALGAPTLAETVQIGK